MTFASSCGRTVAFFRAMATEVSAALCTTNTTNHSTQARTSFDTFFKALVASHHLRPSFCHHDVFPPPLPPLLELTDHPDLPANRRLFLN